MRPPRRVLLFLAIAGVAGLLLVLAGQRFGMPLLIGPGLLLFAAGLVAAGMDTVLRRHSHERDTESGESTSFVGPGARLLGLTTVVAGCVCGVAGVAWTLGAERRLYQHLLARPGSALFAAGLMPAMAGLAAVIGAREWRGSTARFVGRLPERIGGAMLLMLGVALSAAGLFEILAPDGFDQAVGRLLAPLREAVPRER